MSDAVGEAIQVDITVRPPLSVNVDHSSIAVGNTATMIAVGGIGAYSFAASPEDLGTLTGNVFTAAAVGSVTLSVNDERGNQASVVISIVDRLTISPTPTLEMGWEVQSAFCRGRCATKNLRCRRR
ncbi:MAG: hypothetical protein R3C68_06675 [Myxococcota bacterium]